MKALKILGHSMSWIFTLFMFLFLTSMTGVYIGIQLLLAIISCPLVFIILFNKVEVKHKIVVRVVVMLLVFCASVFISSKSSVIIMKNAIEPVVAKQIMVENSDYSDVDIVSLDLYEYAEKDTNQEYIIVTVDYILKSDNNNTRNMKKYDIVYDILTRECISIKEM